MCLIVMCSVSLYSIFPHYLINGTIFENMLLNIKCVFRFSLQLLFKTLFILSRIERNMIKNVHRSLCTLYSCLIVMKLVLSRQFLTKYPNIKLHENPSRESRVVLCAQSDRRTGMTKVIVALRDLA
jgi:5-methylthioribose kinase